jgi:hypothetical protein
MSDPVDKPSRPDSLTPTENVPTPAVRDLIHSESWHQTWDSVQVFENEPERCPEWPPAETRHAESLRWLWSKGIAGATTIIILGKEKIITWRFDTATTSRRNFGGSRTTREKYRYIFDRLIEILGGRSFFGGCLQPRFYFIDLDVGDGKVRNQLLYEQLAQHLTGIPVTLLRYNLDRSAVASHGNHDVLRRRPDRINVEVEPQRNDHPILYMNGHRVS